MESTLSSIHIYGSAVPKNTDFSFRLLSPNWLTCIGSLAVQTPDCAEKAARLISKATDAPILYFGVFDSEMLWFPFFCGRKRPQDTLTMHA